MNMETILGVLPVLAALIFSVTVHEVAHGWTAGLFGDPTAKEQGRITLNPIKHIDPFFSVILPTLLYVAGLPAFGGAKPVPFNPNRMRPGTNIQRAIMWVAAAGPISNFILAFLAALLMGISQQWVGEGITGRVGYSFLSAMFLINILLGIFNLLPIPPLDGAKVLAGLLPLSLARGLYQLERYAILFIALIFLLPTGKLIFGPVTWLANQYMIAVDAILQFVR